MTPEECAAALKDRVGDLGGAWMIDRSASARGKELGLSAWSTYYCGRGGVLGDAPADVVVAAFAFFPPEMVTTAWGRGSAVMPPSQFALHYAEICADWGRAHLPGASDRLVELLERCVDAPSPAGLPLFAGWRLVPRPDDAPGRAALLLHCLREHRGGVHAAACTAVGLTPIQAVVAGPYASSASFFGWPEPYPDADPYRAKWAAAEDLTKAGAARPYDALDDAERTELVELVSGLR